MNVVEQMRHDLAVLAEVGRMYLAALDEDPENEMLTLVEALKVTEVREAVERQDAQPPCGTVTGYRVRLAAAGSGLKPTDQYAVFAPEDVEIVYGP